MCAWHSRTRRGEAHPSRALSRADLRTDDRNAIAAHTVRGGNKVGHVQRTDALAIARVADDRSMRIRMVGQVESGAGQVYKFPLRISFFGPADARARWLPHCESNPAVGAVERISPSSTLSLLTLPRSITGSVAQALLQLGVFLEAPKQPRRSKKAAATSAGRSAGSAGSSSGVAKSSAPAAAAEADESDGEVECVGEKSWAERDAELRAQAIVLE